MPELGQPYSLEACVLDGLGLLLLPLALLSGLGFGWARLLTWGGIWLLLLVGLAVLSLYSAEEYAIRCATEGRSLWPETWLWVVQPYLLLGFLLLQGWWGTAGAYACLKLALIAKLYLGQRRLAQADTRHLAALPPPPFEDRV